MDKRQVRIVKEIIDKAYEDIRELCKQEDISVAYIDIKMLPEKVSIEITETHLVDTKLESKVY